jgi:hypothetical protein
MQVIKSSSFDIISSDFIFSVDPGIKNFSLTILEIDDKNLKVLDYYRIQLCSNSSIYADLYKRFDEIITEEYQNSKCTLVIEKQIRSILLCRIEQHVISYFMLKLKNCNIFEVNAKNRIRLLKEYRNQNSSKTNKTNKVTKKDSIDFATDKLKSDVKGRIIMSSLKKKDDFSDTICQVCAILDLY